jgi:hypothetical protein
MLFGKIDPKWNFRKDNVVEAILLDIRYKFNKVDKMANLLDVIDKEFPTLFLKDDVTRTITIV